MSARARCSSPPSAGPPSSATSSTSSPSPARPCRSPPAATPRFPAGSARSTWSSRSRSRAGPPGRSPWPPRPPAAAPRCSPSARQARRWPRSARGPVACTSRSPPTPSSRTALWSLLTPVLVAADASGLVQCPHDVLERVADVLDEVAEECRPSSESFVNPAKVLATGLGETVPVVLGDGPLTGVAAMPGRIDAGPHRPGAGDARCRCRMPRRRSSPASTGPSAPARSTPGPPAGDDIFADPYLDAPAAPRLGLLALRDPDLDPGRTPWPTPSSRRPATPASPFEQEARSAGRRAARLPRGAHRLRRHLPRARARPRPVGLAPRRRAARPHLLTLVFFFF